MENDREQIARIEKAYREDDFRKQGITSVWNRQRNTNQKCYKSTMAAAAYTQPLRPDVAFKYCNYKELRLNGNYLACSCQDSRMACVLCALQWV